MSYKSFDDETHPVEVLITAFMSVKLYSIAITKAKEVTKPIVRVLISAYGTATFALLHSSAKWIAPSIPARM